MAGGIARGRVGTTAGYDDEVAQHDSHTPGNKFTETNILGLQRISLTLDIHVMFKWHLLLQRIAKPVSGGHIADSSLKFIVVTFCFL